MPSVAELSQEQRELVDGFLRAVGRPEATFETLGAVEQGLLPRMETPLTTAAADVIKAIPFGPSGLIPGLNPVGEALGALFRLPYMTEEQLEPVPGAEVLRSTVVSGMRGVSKLLPPVSGLIGATVAAGKHWRRPSSLEEFNRLKEATKESTKGAIKTGVRGIQQSPAFQPARSVAGKNVVDNPEIMADPNFWVSAVAEQVPALGATLLAGMTGAGLLGGVGTAVSLSPKAVSIMSAVGQALGAGSVGVTLEGNATRDSVLAEGGTQEVADAAALKMNAVVFLTSAVGARNILGVRGAMPMTLRRVLTGAIGNSISEGVEQLAEEPIIASAVGRPIDWSQGTKDAVTAFVKSLPVSGGATVLAINTPLKAAQNMEARRLSGDPVETLPLAAIEVKEIADTSPGEMSFRREMSRAREDFQARLTEALPQAGVDQIEALTQLVHGFVEADRAVLGISEKAAYSKTFQALTATEAPFVEGEAKPPKGATSFLRDGRAVVEFFQNADISTGLHEMFHVFRKRLAESRPALLKQIERSLRVKKGRWSRAHDERFAQLGERWLSQGKAPEGRADLEPAFRKFYNWLHVLYKGRLSALGGKNIPKKTREAFDEMFQFPDTVAMEEATEARVELLTKGPVVAPSTGEILTLTEDAGPLFQREIDDNPTPDNPEHQATPQDVHDYFVRMESKAPTKKIVSDVEVDEFLSAVVPNKEERASKIRALKKALGKEGKLTKYAAVAMVAFEEDIGNLTARAIENKWTPKQAAAEIAHTVSRYTIARQAASEPGRMLRLYQEFVTPQRMEALAERLDQTMSDTQIKLFQKALEDGALIDPTKFSALLENITDPTLQHQILEYVYSNLLSNPATHMLNFGSNWAMLRVQRTERRALEGVAGSMLRATVGQQFQNVPNKKLRGMLNKYFRQEGVFFEEVMRMREGDPKALRKKGLGRAGVVMLEGTIEDEISTLVIDMGSMVHRAIERSDGRFARAVKGVSLNNRFMKALKLDSAAIAVINKMKREGKLTETQEQLVRELPWLLVSSRAMQAADVFARLPALDSQMRALSYRAAREDLAAGFITPDQLTARTRDWFREASKADTKIDRAILIREGGARFARYVTFTSRPGDLTASIQSIRNNKVIGPAIQLFFLKFVNTIANLTKRGVEPIPIVGAVFSITQNIEAANRLSIRLRRGVRKHVRAEMKKAGQEIDPLAVAQKTQAFLENPDTIPQSVQTEAELGGIKGEQDIRRSAESILAAQFEGLVLFGIFAMLYASGRVTGRPPRDPREREAFYALGKIPYSINFGVGGSDFWLQIGRIPVVGTMFSVFVDGLDRIVDRPDDETVESALEQGLAAATHTLLNDSYFGEVSDALQEDTTRSAAVSGVYSSIARTATGFVPYSGFMRSLAHTAELGMTGERKVRDAQALELDGLSAALIKSFSQTIPFAANIVPPKLNVWGDEIVYPTDMLQTWLPLKYSTGSTDIVEKALADVGAEIQMSDFAEDWGNPRPGKGKRKIRMLGVVYSMTEEEYRKATLTIGKAMKKAVLRVANDPVWWERPLAVRMARLNKEKEVARTAANKIVKANLGKQLRSALRSRQDR